MGEMDATTPSASENPCGLRNQGATCYLNAVLQTLFMTEDFRRAVLELEKTNTDVSSGLQELFRCLKSSKGSVSTTGITKALDIRNVHEQQDAAEYYQKILSAIEPEIAKTFQGKKKHSTTCKHRNHKPIEEINSFFSLAIAMDSDQCTINVQESLNSQFEVMLMDGEDQLFCENCNIMTDMEMKCTIPELPEVLTLHLQRFYLDYSYMIYRKNNCPVEIPLQLSVQEEKGGLHKYDLYAVVNHTGSLSGGHYYADIKSSESQWYEFNDSTVYRIKKTYNARNNPGHITSDMACLLFFRKSQKHQAHKAGAQQGKTSMRSDKSKSPQINRTSNPEDSKLHSLSVRIDIENNPDSTVSKEQELPAPLNASDSDTKNTEPIMDKQPEEDNHSSPAEGQDSDNDEAGAHEMKRLQETTANETTVRRKEERRKCLVLCVILVFGFFFFFMWLFS